MPDIGFNTDDPGDLAGFAPYLTGSKLSTDIAQIQRNGASPLPVGFSVDGPEDDSIDPTAFKISPGSATPSSLDAKPTVGAGKVLLSRGPTQMPPPNYQPPPPPSAPVPPPGYNNHAAPTDIPPEMQQSAPVSAPSTSDDPGAAGLPSAGTAMPKPTASPQTQALLAQAKQITDNAPQMIGNRPQDRIPVIDHVTGKHQLDANGQPVTKEKTSAKLASWAQRLGLAAIAATKLAPYAQQIIHPEYTQQVAQQQAALKNIDTQVGLQEKADTGAYYNELRAAQAQKNIEQGADYAAREQEKQQRDQPHFGKVQIDPSQAKTAFPLHVPEPDGSVWVEKSEAVEKEKELGKPLIVKEGDVVLDPITHQAIYTAPKKADEINTEFKLWQKDNPTGTAADWAKFQQQNKPDPASAGKQQYTKIMEKVVGEGLIPPAALSDVNKISAAINASKTLTPDEKNQAIAYQIANPTPASNATAGILRIDALGATRPVNVINKNTGELQIVSADVAMANPSLYAPAGEGTKAMGKQAVFDDLHYNINAARNAIGALSSIDAGTRAALANQLQESDPKSAVSAFLHGAVGSALSPEQQHAVQALAQLSENALSMRSISGMGQGSQDLRDAIRSVLPSAKSPSKEYMQEQLNNFEQVVRRLEGGVPGIGNAVPSARNTRTNQSPTSPAGNVVPGVNGQSIDLSQFHH